MKICDNTFKMILKEVPGLEIVAHVSDGFISKWSEDDNVIIVTKNGIYSFQYYGTLETHETSFTFKKNLLIPNSYYPSIKNSVDLDSFFDLLPQEYFYEGILDQNISADLKYLSSKEYFFNSAVWSPLGIIDRTHCVLATINNYGAVELALHCKDKWIYISKVTDTVIKHESSKWQDISSYPTSHKFPIYQKRIYDVATSCLTWSSMYENFCILILGHISGKITFWTIHKHESYPEHYITLNHLAAFNDFENRITALHWLPVGKTALLLMGTIKGEVKSVEIDSASKEKLDFGAINKIWPHQDLIKVSHITSLILNKSIYVLIIKGTFVLCMKIDQYGCVLSKKHLHIGNLNITDVQQYSHDSFAILTQTGAVYLAKIKPCEAKFELLSSRGRHTLKSVERTYHGMFASPNGAFWGIISYPQSMRTNKTKGVDTIKIHLCIDETKNPGVLVANNPFASLKQFWDCLDVMRSTSMKKKTLPSAWLDDTVDPDTLSLYELKVYYWLSSSCKYYIKRIGSSLLKNTLPAPEKLKEVILLKVALSRAKQLIKNHKQKQQLSVHHWHSLQLIRDALDAFRDSSGNKDTWKKFITVDIDPLLMEMVDIEEIQSLGPQKCGFCDEDLKGFLCRTPHPDQRCCISLLQIDTCAKYYCPKCCHPVHESVEEEWLFCPFCDIPFVTNFLKVFEWETEQQRLKTTSDAADTSDKEKTEEKE